MKSSLMAILAILTLAAIVLMFAAARLGGIPRLIRYLRKNTGVLGGIIAFTLVGIISIWATRVDADPQSIDYGPTTYQNSVQWFQGGWMYLGLDTLRKESPQCHPGAVSDKLTSNGGVEVNILQSFDQRFRLNAKYTHHSCAFNEDSLSYDSLGLVVVYRLW